MLPVFLSSHPPLPIEVRSSDVENHVASHHLLLYTQTHQKRPIRDHSRVTAHLFFRDHSFFVFCLSFLRKLLKSLPYLNASSCPLFTLHYPYSAQELPSLGIKKPPQHTTGQAYRRSGQGGSPPSHHHPHNDNPTRNTTSTRTTEYCCQDACGHPSTYTTTSSSSSITSSSCSPFHSYWQTEETWCRGGDLHRGRSVGAYGRV